MLLIQNMEKWSERENPKLRIAIDTTYMDRRGAMGTAVYIREFVERLDTYSSEFDITLVHHESIPEDPVYQKYKEIIIRDIPAPKGRRLISEAFFFLTTRKKFDVYFFAYSRLNPLFFLAPAKYIISMQYDGGPETAGLNLGKNYGKIKPWLLPAMRRYIDIFIASSEFGRRGLIEARKLPSEKVRVLYAGASPLFRPIPKTEAWALLEKEYGYVRGPLIIASGRLDPHKNILRLVEAFDILKKRYNIKHKLILTGGIHSPEYSNQVLDAIKQRGLEDDFIILKIRKFSEMPYFYSAADAMVFPSLYEGFGLPLVEAMQCGVPTVVARSSSLIEVGGAASEFFDPLDPDDMAKAIHRVLSDPTYASQLVEESRTQVKKFTWEQYTAGLIGIVRELGRRK